MADTPPAGSLYLLDAHGLIFQMFHGVGPMSAPDGRPTNAVFGVTRRLMSLYDRGADYLIADPRPRRSRPSATRSTRTTRPTATRRRTTCSCRSR